MANFQLSILDEVTLTCSPTNKEGQIVPDSVTWVSDNANLVLTPSIDTLSCLCVPSNTPTVGINVLLSDADGNKADFMVDLIDGVPVAFMITAGKPVPKPTPTPAP